MIEVLTRGVAARVFGRGAIVSLVGMKPNTEVRGAMMPGVVEDWTASHCRINLKLSENQRLPRPGDEVEIIATRLDGIFRAPATVTNLEVTETRELFAARALITVRVRAGDGVREQHRAFFRASGAWRAVICRPNKRHIAGKDDYHPAMVWNLSAGGMLIEDRHHVLALGLRCRFFLDLGDDDDPLRLEAEVVRCDERCSGEIPQWGCRFDGIDEASAMRICRHLNQKLRARVGAVPRGAAATP